MNHEDNLLDAMLKEQARNRDADEALLERIEQAIDSSELEVEKPSAFKRVLPLSIAAALAMGGAAIYYEKYDDSPEIASYTVSPAQGDRSNTGVSDAEVTINEVGNEVTRKTNSIEAPNAPGEEQQAAVPGNLSNDLESKYIWHSGEADPAASLKGVRVTPPAYLSTDAAPNLTDLSEVKESISDSVVFGKYDDRSKDIRIEGALIPGAPADDMMELSELKDEYARLTSNGPAPAVESAPMPKPMVTAGLSTDGAYPAAKKRELERLPVEEMARGKFSAPELHEYRERNEKAIRDYSQLSRAGRRDSYSTLVDQPWRSPVGEEYAKSTFSIDVDTASYTNIRRMIQEHRAIPKDAVRIEECINYFDYEYPQPKGENQFTAHALLATCPWNEENLLARVAIKGREIHQNARPASNLVFLIDVSGSMQSPDKLPMLKRSMKTLINSLDERDRVGMVVYAGTQGVVLDQTVLDDDGKTAALAAVDKLESGGSTNGGAGIQRAYEMALKNKIDGGVNRVILATDGDFNVGVTRTESLVEMVKEKAANGVYISVLGYGTGNLQDDKLEAITNDGDGNYFYVDNDEEATRIFEEKLTSTLVTIAKDVKIQVEFNPAKVKSYRLIGYANRVLRNEDFDNDKVDAGDIGAGHTVTAFYEIVPANGSIAEVEEADDLIYQRRVKDTEVVPSDDWLTLKLRYKHPEGGKSSKISTPVKGEPVKWEDAGDDFRMASGVALFGMKLRGMEDVADVTWGDVEEIVRPALAGDGVHERRGEFLELIKRLKPMDAKVRPNPAALEMESR